MKTEGIYQTVTDTIIKLLENHQGAWNRPWIAFGEDNSHAHNALSGSYYRGINQFLLGFTLMEKGYRKNAWLTFNQVKELGGNVVKGEKSSPIVFYKTGYVDKGNVFHPAEKVKAMPKKEQEDLKIKPVPILKLYRLFNVAQTEGLPPTFHEVKPQEPLQGFEKDERAENLIRSTNADIEITQSNKAYYDPERDRIKLPLREQFRGGAEPFYATALHELGHWTGHHSRLDRDMKGAFGEQSYGREELVAELASAFCCAALGFSKAISQNAAYIQSWLGILKADNKAVVRASFQAQKAADYILAFRPG